MRDFLLSDGILTSASYYLAGDPPANAAQLTETLHFPVSSDTVTPDGAIPDRAAEYHPALFAAFPVTADSIPPDDFETLGANDLPPGWPTFWTDSLGGGVGLYNSYGTDSFSGDNVLRLHVGAGGGSTFIVSDPISVQADRFYAVTVQMRYSLASPSEAACFTVLQYDSAGQEIAINEADGIAGDNYWTWKRKALCIHTLPDAATIRIRFGLIASTEAYLDIDTLR